MPDAFLCDEPTTCFADSSCCPERTIGSQQVVQPVRLRSGWVTLILDGLIASGDELTTPSTVLNVQTGCRYPSTASRGSWRALLHAFAGG